MQITLTKKTTPFRGEITIPGDKSISHRSVMFGAIAKGTTEITNFPQGADCLSTIDCFRKMGITIEHNKKKILVHGNGLHGLKAPIEPLYTGNSGTTTRLISGILAGQDFASTLSGDASLNSRPMKRIMEPLRSMGADIISLNHNDCAPLRIQPGTLHGIHYHSTIASAQVKSAILLAGLYADGKTSVSEPVLSRNHTELMLQSFGAALSTSVDRSQLPCTTIEPCSQMYGQKIHVPGDISSAAYFIAAALLIPGSELLIKNVGINPTRAGILKVCQAMGADITYFNRQTVSGEPTADLLVKYSILHGTTVEGDIIPTLIDELPIIAVLAAYAEGTTIIRDAAELKVKETNRITTTTEALQALGGIITPTDDGMIIEGTGQLTGNTINSHLDHRIAMAFAIAALAAHGETTIQDSQCVDVSYPDFFKFIS